MPFYKVFQSRLCLLYFAQWCFAGFLDEVMQQHKLIFFPIEEKYAVCERAQLP